MQIEIRESGAGKQSNAHLGIKFLISLASCCNQERESARAQNVARHPQIHIQRWAFFLVGLWIGMRAQGRGFGERDLSPLPGTAQEQSKKLLWGPQSDLRS